MPSHIHVFVDEKACVDQTKTRTSDGELGALDAASTGEAEEPRRAGGSGHGGEGGEGEWSGGAVERPREREGRRRVGGARGSGGGAGKLLHRI